MTITKEQLDEWDARTDWNSSHEYLCTEESSCGTCAYVREVVRSLIAYVRELESSDDYQTYVELNHALLRKTGQLAASERRVHELEAENARLRLACSELRRLLTSVDDDGLGRLAEKEGGK